MFRGRMKPIMLVVALLSVILGVPAAAVAASGLRPDGVPADYPNKEIQYIYAFSPGSIQDAYIRKLADKIQKMEGWKHGIIVVYREGASGRIGWSAVAKAKPDGYSIGFAPSAMLISSVAENAPYGHEKLSFVFNMMTDPGAIGVVADSPYKTLGELDVVIWNVPENRAETVYEAVVSDQLNRKAVSSRNQIQRFADCIRNGTVGKILDPHDPGRKFEPAQFANAKIAIMGNQGALAAGFDAEIDLTRFENDYLQRRLIDWRKAKQAQGEKKK